MTHEALAWSVVSLTVIEVAATAAMTQWARTGGVGVCVLGLGLFMLLGMVLGMSIRAISHMNTVNAAWQAFSIVGVSILSTVCFGEPITAIQCVGVGLAIVASLCFAF